MPAFEYQLIPLDERIAATPAIPFCYFDPQSGVYVDRSIAPIPITVDPSPSAAVVDGQSSLVEARSLLRDLLERPDAPTALADSLGTSGRTATNLGPTHRQAWFVGLQLLPALLLSGLWIWDRRRRYFEQHPEVLVRRRARKAITGHARRARKAARRGDARGFLQHAIRGLQEASAPDAPGEPRAMVCDDILGTLPAELLEGDTPQLVKKLWTAANDWSFGAEQPDRQNLLGLAHEVDGQLNELRRRL